MRFTLETLFVAAFCAGAASAQATEESVQTFALDVDSGAHSGDGVATRLAFETTVSLPNARWLWLDLSGTALGPGSHLGLLSEQDAGYQVFDTLSLSEWSERSANFNGGTVHLQLWVGPYDPGSSLILRQASAAIAPPAATESLCGSDSRVPSSDNRVGRVISTTGGFCTGWRTTHGAIATAGHCGTPALIEFNVPLSDPDGTANGSLPEDQYPVDLSQWQFQNSPDYVGDDWMIFGVNRNSNTGLLPHEAYGFPFRVTNTTPGNNGTFRLTGFGDDDSPPGSTGGENFRTNTNQTSTGPFLNRWFIDSDTIFFEYQVDSDSGNSGGPLIGLQSDISFGIHTNGGCDLGNGFGNAGTSFQETDLGLAMVDFRGTNSVYVDAGHSITSQSGSVFNPFRTFAQGVSGVPTGGVVSMVEGDYSVGGGMVITKAMTLESPTGRAILD